jgi:hypothetical protein
VWRVLPLLPLPCDADRVASNKCSMAARVPYDKAEAAVHGVIEDVLCSYPAWLQAVAASMREAIRQAAQGVPKALSLKKAHQVEIETEIGNLMKLLRSGMDSPAIRADLARLESEKSALIPALLELERTPVREDELPDDAWVRGQLADIGSLLKDHPAESVRLLRSIIGTIVAEEVKATGKTRGYTRLCFKIDGWAALAQVLAKKLPVSLLSALKPANPAGGASEAFVIDLGAPTKMDDWAPKIAQWRKEGVIWSEIARRTGLKMSNAYTAYKRFKDGGGQAA